MNPRNHEPVLRTVFGERVVAADENIGLRLAWEEFKRKRGEETQRDKNMKKEWLTMTEQEMDSEDLCYLQCNHTKCHGAFLQPKDFKRLKATWLMLTGTMDLNYLHKLKRDYIMMNQSKMRYENFLILKKYWPLLSTQFNPSDLETLKRDYLVLNWSKISEIDYTRFKVNWLALVERTGINNLESIIKGWLKNQVLDIEYRYMSEKRKIEFVRFYLERGADVNYAVAGDTLLHKFVSSRYNMLIAPLIELLLSYGADVTVRTPNGWSVLDKFRIYYYKDHADIVCMLQVAEKAARKNTETETLLHVAGNKQDISSSSMHNNTQSEFNAKLNETEQQWIQSYESIYLKIIIDLLNRVKLTDIDDLLLSAINYMFISKTPRMYIKFSQNINQLCNIRRIHKIYSRMCSKLFNTFDLHFTQSIDVSFPRTGIFCENAELVSSLEIHPELEWVALKLFAVPSDIVYYIYCVAGSKSCFSLCENHTINLLAPHIRIRSYDILKYYKRHFSEEQQRRLTGLDREFRGPWASTY